MTLCRREEIVAHIWLNAFFQTLVLVCSEILKHTFGKHSKGPTFKLQEYAFRKFRQ